MTASPTTASAAAPDDRPELSIVMPCLNEARTLEACIGMAQRFLARSGVTGEIVVGDNGSTDGSQEIARRCGARVVDVPVRGYGAALFAATRASRGRFVVMGDSDGTYDFERLEPFLDKLREGFDLVVGNRFRGGIAPGAMPWKNRWLGNPALSAMGRLLYGAPVGDFHCGLRAFAREAFDRMDLRTTTMEYATEMVVKATLRGLRITEVPTTLRPGPPGRRPHLLPWRDGWRHLRFMLLHGPRWLFLYPGLALVLVGLAVGAWVLSGPRRLGHVGLDASVLLHAAVAVLVGAQAVAFAVFAELLAIREGLSPGRARLTELSRRVTLEVGLAIGGGLALAGLAASLAAAWWLRSKGLGPLESPQALRVLVPSALALGLGCQTMLSSFFVSLLRLPVRRPDG